MTGQYKDDKNAEKAYRKLLKSELQPGVIHVWLTSWKCTIKLTRMQLENPNLCIQIYFQNYINMYMLPYNII